MRNFSRQHIMDKTETLVRTAAFELRPDVLRLIESAYRREKGRSRKALGWIIENARNAREDTIALCQDTGLPIVFIECGRGKVLDDGLVMTVRRGIESAYEKLYLRPSAVDPLERITPSYRGAVIHCLTGDHAGIRVTLLQKGFGSENKSRLMMFNPTASVDDIEQFVLAAVAAAGPEACPPFVVGVGIGGTSDTALLAAKEAYLEPLDKSGCALEARLLKKVNTLGIGPMGFGGKTTALAVKVKKMPTHIAGLPVGVNISCWALRTATVTL